MYCKNCGNQISLEDKFCNNCGQASNQESFHNNTEVDRPRDESDKTKQKLKFRKYFFFLAPFIILFLTIALWGLVSVVRNTIGADSLSTFSSILNILIPIVIAASVIFIPVGIFIGMRYHRKLQALTRDDVYDERSGQGENSIVPQEIKKGWSWGAMFLNWIWGASHGVWSAFLVFIPIFNIFYIFVLGYKGREWAWKKNKYKSIEEFNKIQRRWSIAAVIIFLLGIIFAILSASLNSAREMASSGVNADITPEISENISNDFGSTSNTSVVVNVLCPSSFSDEETAGGSGTIITENGIILTNSHVIPQDKKSLHTTEAGCIVVLPDPITGQAKDIYLAEPIVIPGLSDDYDLAFLSIYSGYYDEEEKKSYGVFPRKFPAYQCENSDVNLGDPVRVLGYPSISGGYSLTVTDGIVSSLPVDGIIYTSAKISHGNSGGLAVDADGCMIGVPTLVITDENTSLGIIYSVDLINEFLDKLIEITG